MFMVNIHKHHNTHLFGRIVKFVVLNFGVEYRRRRKNVSGGWDLKWMELVKGGFFACCNVCRMHTKRRCCRDSHEFGNSTVQHFSIRSQRLQNIQLTTFIIVICRGRLFFQGFTISYRIYLNCFKLIFIHCYTTLTSIFSNKMFIPEDRY